LAVSGVRLLGLDLAWSPRNPSGAAALAPDGRLLDVRHDLGDDDDVVAWVRAQRGPSGVIGIDMPTIVPNAAGARPCERELGAAFRRYHAGPYPANNAMELFRGGGRARRIIDALAADGVVEDVAIVPGDPRTVAIEVFPHAAHVRLFALDRIFQYKRKPGRPHLAEWARYRAHMASLAGADPPLVLDDVLVPREAASRGYKRHDDLLDAITCAYVAAFVHRWGSELPHVRVFGDLVTGYIVVPARSAFGC
jgi:predicted RNase H-like nuclease